MTEIKYQYAYDESGRLIDINECPEEERRCHIYHCLGCGKELRPRAIGSKYKRAHFYHKGQAECNTETYLHKLGKLLVKQKFDSTESFMVSYPITKSCNKESCTLRNSNCDHKGVMHEVDLKRYYDTCRLEAPIKGFIADLLLTSSHDASIPPTLIEICVTHPCSDEKRASGLKIIELKIGTEQDIRGIISNGMFEGSLSYSSEHGAVKLIGYRRYFRELMEEYVYRYIFNPRKQESGYLTRVSCHQANHKLYKDSITELNIRAANTECNVEILTPLFWMHRNKQLRRCDICQFYYATAYEDKAICRLSNKYGKPKFPKMKDAEECRSFRVKDNFLTHPLNGYKIEEVTLPPIDIRDDFRVIIACGRSFTDYDLIKEKCDCYLSDKMKTHKVIIMYLTLGDAKSQVESYADERSLVVEPYKADWDRIGRGAGYIMNEVMLRYADALIVFYNGSEAMIEKLLEGAKNKGIKVGCVESKKKQNPSTSR